MLKIQELSKEFSGRQILCSVSTMVEMGKITALLGPSGGGKSTLLRCLSRLEQETTGAIEFMGRPIKSINPTDIGMVFQGFHLFPHLTVLENVSFSPKKVLKQPCHQVHENALDLLDKFGLGDKTRVYPGQLSGGQKQRVAIVRALIMEPKLLLFDEPTSALDPELVQEIAGLIQSLLSPNRLIIMASHDLRIVKRIADHVLFLDQGHLVEDSSASEFFLNPKSEKGRLFIKKMT